MDAKMHKALALYKQAEKLINESYDLSMEYLMAELKKADGNIIGFFDENGEPIISEFCVTYDGGRHPEYNANPFSTVYSVRLENGEILLDTEDCDEYPIKHLDKMEAISVADSVYHWSNP